MIYIQTKKTAEVTLEKEKADVENKVKQDELEERLNLKERLLEQERERTKQDNMITALASDYTSVYYVNLDDGEGICYRSDVENKSPLKQGEHFKFNEIFTKYADEFVAEAYRDDFKAFIKTDNIRKALEKEQIIIYKYLVIRDGKES